MVNALLYMQGFGVVHRDIKPENIMVTPDGVRLSDFGWAVRAGVARRDTFCGTPDYFSPEVVMYTPFDYKVDNWALGILAYELLCGNPPFYAQ